MKTLSIILLSFLFPFNLTGQESIAEKEILIGFSFTPQFSSVDIGDDPLEESKNSFSFTLGGNLIWAIKEKVQLQTGISFQSATISQRDYTPMFPMDHMHGEALPFLSYYEYRVKYTSLGIPVQAKILFGNGHNHTYFSLGGSVKQIIDSNARFQLIESGLVVHPLESKDYGIELDKTQIYANAGFGYDFKIGIKRLAIGPTFEYVLKNYLKIQENELTPEYVGGNPFFPGIQFLYY